MLKGRQGGEINDITRQAIRHVNDTFCKELRSRCVAATVLKNFKRMTPCSASQCEIKKFRAAESDKAEDYF